MFLQVESTAEGEAQRYFDHALTLKNTILFLRYNKELTQDQGPDIPNIGTSKRVCTLVVCVCKQHCPVMGYFTQHFQLQVIVPSRFWRAHVTPPFSLHARLSLGYAAL